ncbi:Gfo/Idh/MocA family oxidoreductase [Kibdelosporangium philippinense]|uniref:Gfo/Idh/MocA family oxidoreductase n=1 Tax=Kibdelosporangium philippinense TaxID=211113 RepID=A0ABS8ZRM0_9PSEU|nr:Gfo/Idh/MocA family oxidoreductase [Kibdelosporangium philippinense]MCE7010364.1 Gfo/Idh/MocA family oxidoreductase [Kibdelosporangium philippinense]
MSTLPAPRTPDPMDAPAVRWGILAPGWIANLFCTALRQGTRQEIAAIGSRSYDRAKAFADEFDAVAAYGSYEELVNDPQVDIVYVASPHSEHHHQARLALEAGKAVLVEKAFTRNAAEARDLVDLARSKNLLLIEAMWARFLPHYDVIRQVVENGLIGDITTVYADHDQPLYPNGPERLSNPALAGGALLDLGVYPISFAEFVLGQFTSITAVGTLTDLGVDSQQTVVVTNAAGAQGVLHSSMLARSATTASVCGTAGRLDIGGPFYEPNWIKMYDRDDQLVGQHEKVADIGHGGLRYQAAEAARCLTEGRTESAVFPLDATLRVMEAMDNVRAQLGVRYPGE